MTVPVSYARRGPLIDRREDRRVPLARRSDEFALLRWSSSLEDPRRPGSPDRRRTRPHDRSSGRCPAGTAASRLVPERAGAGCERTPGGAVERARLALVAARGAHARLARLPRRRARDLRGRLRRPRARDGRSARGMERRALEDEAARAQGVLARARLLARGVAAPGRRLVAARPHPRPTKEVPLARAIRSPCDAPPQARHRRLDRADPVRRLLGLAGVAPLARTILDPGLPGVRGQPG